MPTLNPATGLWEDDASGPAPPNQPGALGAQQDTPQTAPIEGPPVPPGMGPVEGPPVPPGVGEGSPPPPLAAPAPATPPPIAPYTPEPAGPLPSPSRAVAPSEVATLGALDKNAAAQATTAQQSGALGGDKAKAALAQAETDQAEQLRHQAESQKLIDDAAKKTEALQAHAQQLYDEHAKMGIKDPEADQSFGHRLLAAIAIGLGEYSSKMNGGPNRAAELIQAANAQNIALQKNAIEKKYREAELAGKDVTEAKAEETAALQRLELKHSSLLMASAQKFKVELARMGIPEQQIAANQEVQKVEADALQKREAVNRQIATEQAGLIKADMRKKAAGTGGGAGAVDAMTAFTNAAGQLKPGDQIPPDVVALGMKAGLKRDKIAAQVDAYRGSGTKATILGEKSNAPNEKVDAEMRKELYPPSGKGPGTQLERIQAMRAELKDAIAGGDKTAATRIIEEAGGMLSGGKTTKVTATLLEDLKSTGDQLASSWGKITGNPGDTQAYTERLDKLLAGTEKEKQYEVDAVTKRYAANRAAKGGGAPTATASAAAPVDKMAAARRVAADPNAPQAARARALQFINAGQ